MDFCRNVPISGECHEPEQQLAGFPSATLDDLFSAQNTEVDVSLEWLSVFVEDCFSSRGNCLPLPTMDVVQSTSTIPKPSKPSLQLQKPQQQQQNQSSLQKVPGKARSKRKRVTSLNAKNPFTSSSSSWSHHMTNSDPPLLQQAYWLADSELIVPKEDHQQEIMEVEEVDEDEEEEEKVVVVVEKENLIMGGTIIGQQPRRCTHCLSQRTPQWRAGPLGPKTLCNACGVRYKSGRLLPEYRPAKSPTFVSNLHSNSHKKVMEMRMSIPSEQ